MYGVITILGTLENNTRKRCDEWGVRHEWVKKGDGDNKYLVCEKCKVLLSGLKEENDRGNHDS
jgi:hypothetical protein